MLCLNSVYKMCLCKLGDYVGHSFTKESTRVDTLTCGPGAARGITFCDPMLRNVYAARPPFFYNMECLFTNVALGDWCNKYEIRFGFSSNMNLIPPTVIMS